MAQLTPTAPTEFTPRDLRQACGQFATGVTVVTVRDGDGARGMTANSFTSVSLDPPLVLVSIDCRNRTHEILTLGSPFVVNVLAEAQREWSDRFAGRHGDLQGAFEDVPHRLTDDGVPVLDGSLPVLHCRVDDIHPAGDHCLFIGRVERVECAPGESPLLFFGGGYQVLAGRDEATARTA
ncbi:MAG: flavin reductase family protein [Chloroflexota bacterium]|nr:flavin reductase family protein [Chloroflexota bacterium]